MKRVLTVDESMRIWSLLGILDGEKDFRDFGFAPYQTLSMPELINLFPCSKSSPIFELTRGGYGAGGKFDKNWRATLEYNNLYNYYIQVAKEPIDAVYKLLCEYLENANDNKKKK